MGGINRNVNHIDSAAHFRESCRMVLNTSRDHNDAKAYGKRY